MEIALLPHCLASRVRARFRILHCYFSHQKVLGLESAGRSCASTGLGYLPFTWQTPCWVTGLFFAQPWETTRSSYKLPVGTSSCFTLRSQAL